jgi:L-rhamnonate dehydratase
MRITEVTPHLLRGHEVYGSAAGADEATDQGDWLLLIQVRTDEGLEGWSDVETLAPAATRVVAGQGMGALGFRTLSELLVGKDPADVEGLWDEMYVGTAYYGRRGLAMHAISAVDNCLWSIRAQAGGHSLAEELGGRRRDALKPYASTLFRQTPEENAAAAGRYLALGYRGVKFGWGGFGRDDALDRDNLAAVRDVLGPEVAFMVDPGWYVDDGGRPRTRTRAETETMLASIGEIDPEWVEDFVHPEMIEQYASFKEDFPQLAFAAGEQLATVWELRRLRDSGVDVLQPDLTRCGGLTVATALATDLGGAQIVTHSWLTDFLHAYSAHFLATLPSAPWVEFNVAQSELSRSVAISPLRLDGDGRLPVPTGPGLGVEPDRAFVDARSVGLGP